MPGEPSDPAAPVDQADESSSVVPPIRYIRTAGALVTWGAALYLAGLGGVRAGMGRRRAWAWPR